jgi:hypothetical protein
MLSFSISYPDLIKFPYFADTTERGDRRPKQRVTLLIILFCKLIGCPPPLFFGYMLYKWILQYHMSFLMVGDTTELSFLLSLALRFFWRIIMVKWIAKI